MTREEAIRTLAKCAACNGSGAVRCSDDFESWTVACGECQDGVDSERLEALTVLFGEKPEEGTR